MLHFHDRRQVLPTSNQANTDESQQIPPPLPSPSPLLAALCSPPRAPCQAQLEVWTPPTTRCVVLALHFLVCISQHPKKRTELEYDRLNPKRESLPTDRTLHNRIAPNLGSQRHSRQTEGSINIAHLRPQGMCCGFSATSCNCVHRNRVGDYDTRW